MSFCFVNFVFTHMDGFTSAQSRDPTCFSVSFSSRDFFFNAINVYSVDIIIDVIILTVQQKTLLAIKKDNHNILENRGKGKQVIELVISYLVTKHPYSHLFVTTISKLKSQRA